MQIVEYQQGTKGKLNNVLNELLSKHRGRIEGCAIINERGLVVESVGLDIYMADAMAAMVALLSETTKRVTRNLHLDRPQSVTIRTEQFKMIIVEFIVFDQIFRIGGIITSQKRRPFFVVRGRKDDEVILLDLASKVKRILESE